MRSLTLPERAPGQIGDNALEHARAYPRLRFMGSKHRLLPWLHEILSDYRFKTALDPFSGSGAVSYLLKCMGKRVTSPKFQANSIPL